MTGRGDLPYRSFEHGLRHHGCQHSSDGCEAALTQSLATPALARCSSERAYFMTWERSEWPISSASSLTCPGLACKNHVPNVRLRSWGFTSCFLMPLFLTHEYRRRLRVFSVTRSPFSLRKRWVTPSGRGAPSDESNASRSAR